MLRFVDFVCGLQGFLLGPGCTVHCISVSSPPKTLAKNVVKDLGGLLNPSRGLSRAPGRVAGIIAPRAPR